MVLKESPAVYAWYRSLDLVAAAVSQERFIAALHLLFSAKLSDLCSARLGYLYQVTVQETGGPLGERSRTLLEQIATSARARSTLAAMLQDATYLQAPLYVGKALNLRQRIGDHLTGASGLLDRLSSATLPVETCVLRYKYIDEDDVAVIAEAINAGGDRAATDSVALLVEEMLTRLGPSAFVRRPG
jgi:hypothetical protein